MNRPPLMRILIITAIALSFGRLGFHEFSNWDDQMTIYQNANLNPPTLKGIAHYWTAIADRSAFGLYIPVTYTFWSALAAVAQLDQPDEFGIKLNPYVFHLANVVVHILSALVVFEILRMIVPNAWAACAGALLWGLHPVQVEPVGWASGAKDVLCGFFSFVAIWQYLKFAKSPPRAGHWHYVIATVALLAGMLAKPTALVVPLIALTLDTFAMKRPLRSSVANLWPWFVLIFPCIIWTKLSQSTVGIPRVALPYRPLIATDALAHYIYKLLLPIRLGIDYGRRPLRVLEEGWLWYTWLLPAAVAIVLWIFRKRLPLVMVGAIIFVIGVLPVLGFVPFMFQFFSTVADHYLYISLLGAALALAALAARAERYAWAIACAMLLPGIFSFRQAATWRDDFTIFSNAIRINPESFVAHNNLAAAHVQRVRYDQAEPLLRKAIELFPDYATARDSLAQILIVTNRREEAIEQIERVLEINQALPEQLRPNIEKMHLLLGEYLLKQGNPEDAAKHFRAALQINPANAQASDGLARALQSPSPATTPAG